jgi:hypothetical protein
LLSIIRRVPEPTKQYRLLPQVRTDCSIRSGIPVNFAGRRIQRVGVGKRQRAAFEHDCVAVTGQSVTRVHRDLHRFIGGVDGCRQAEQLDSVLHFENRLRTGSHEHLLRQNNRQKTGHTEAIYGARGPYRSGR